MTQEPNRAATMDKIVALSKRRGFVYPGSDIYGGLANTWDFGPLGTELRNNIKQLWWRMFVQKRRDMVGLDAGVLMHPKVWEASGHVGGFNDPMVDCRETRARYRAEFDAIFFNIAYGPGCSIPAELGCDADEQGSLLTDTDHETSIPGIYAAGDITPGSKLAVRAAAEGTRAAIGVRRSLLPPERRV